MPNEIEEETTTEARPIGPSLRILTWWRKFHFSGRVIMCSVLLGFGLILIGGLLFAINVNDDDSSNSNSEEVPKQPTKAPSHYTGPVVMGIGGFIVVTGIIMCLFETQICRKRTGDSSPLISDQTEDPEKKGSDPTSVPSTSHCNKSHKHGTRKTSPSPKKSKNRHAKSRSKERNQQKSSQSPPVPIEPSKSFLTSSEDKFTTPPNTLEGNTTSVKNDNSCESDDKHSALMKSFTSSNTSWNQSAEFLTPSTSFRDLTATVSKSENEDAIDLKTTKVLEKKDSIPLTVEEDRIQKLLIRVKKEQKQMADAKRESNAQLYENHGSDSCLSPSEIQSTIINKDYKESKKSDGENNPTNELLREISSTSTASEDVNQKQTVQIENVQDVNQNKCETNVSEVNLKVTENEAVKDEIPKEAVNVAEGKKLSPCDDEEKISSPTNAEDLDLTICCDEETSEDKVEKNEKQVDLESSVSSDETVVSPDSFQENHINDGISIEKATLSTTLLEENSTDENKGLKASESPNKDTTTTDNDDIDHLNSQVSIPNSDEAEVRDLNLSKNNDVVVSKEMENVSKDVSS